MRRCVHHGQGAAGGRVAEERHDLHAHPVLFGNAGRHDERVAGRRFHADVRPWRHDRLAEAEQAEGRLHGLDGFLHGRRLRHVSGREESDRAFHEAFSGGLGRRGDGHSAVV
jgi:hypothetical protein